MLMGIAQWADGQDDGLRRWLEATPPAYQVTATGRPFAEAYALRAARAREVLPWCPSRMISACP